jgi:hypothetical protein
VKKLHQNILADFSWTVDGISVFVRDGYSPTGVLQIMHGLASFHGAPSRARYPMCTFAFEGYVSGVDVSTMVFGENQLTITQDITVPGTLDRVCQLINDEPNAESINPLKATDANIKTTNSHALTYFPFETLESLLGADIMTHQVCELIVLALVDDRFEET